MRTIDIIAAVLLLIGGLNWGLVGIFQFDLVAAVFGGVASAISRAIYTLVGLSAVYGLVRVLNWSTIKASYCVGFEKPAQKGV